MGRGAPNKPGLTYFPKMIDFYEDDKIFDLLDRYGPLGVTVYDCILCIVYREGYYAEIPVDKLSKMITRMIGNKWVKNQKAVVQVVHFCSEIGLLDDDLMTKNIITSVGIQRRYYEIAVKRMKRQLYTDKYWLLDKTENEKPLLNAPLNQISSEENEINSEFNHKSSEENAIEIKENKKIYSNTFPPELERALDLYFLVREQNYGPISDIQKQSLVDELKSIGSDTTELIAIVKKATSGGYKTFYPTKRKREDREKKTVSKTRFSNFEERDYNMADLERQLLEKG